MVTEAVKVTARAMALAIEVLNNILNLVCRELKVSNSQGWTERYLGAPAARLYSLAKDDDGACRRRALI